MVAGESEKTGQGSDLCASPVVLLVLQLCMRQIWSRMLCCGFVVIGNLGGSIVIVAEIKCNA